jgi:hypothetical protein
MSNLRFVIIEIILVGGVFLLSRWARSNPNEPLTIVLFRLGFGPRTDVKYMTRSELFHSAASFLTWALIFAIILLVLVFASFPGGKEPPVIAEVFLFGITIALGMSGLAAAYLGIRGVFRSSKYTPPAREDGEDEE